MRKPSKEFFNYSTAILFFLQTYIGFCLVRMFPFAKTVCILFAFILFVFEHFSLMHFRNRFLFTLGNIGVTWFGFSIYIAFFFLICDIISLLMHGSAFHILSYVALLLGISVGVYGILHANRIYLKEYTIDSDRKLSKKYHINLISDIHLGAMGYMKRVPEMFRIITDQKPDILCIAGDLFDNRFRDIDNLDTVKEFFLSLRIPMGIYMCTGNHDSGEDYADMMNFCKECNINVLHDESAVQEDELVISGRNDISFYDKEAGRNELEKTDRNDRFHIVLDHNPGNIPEYSSDTDLLLMGHTHFGQIIPGCLFTHILFMCDHGFMKKSDKNPDVIVSQGAGTWGMSMRVGTNCEVVSINLV